MERIADFIFEQDGVGFKIIKSPDTSYKGHLATNRDELAAAIIRGIDAHIRSLLQNKRLIESRHRE